MVWLDQIIDDCVRWAVIKAYHGVMYVVANKDAIAHWLRHHHCEFVSLFTVWIGIIMVWILHSYLATWEAERAEARRKTLTEPLVSRDWFSTAFETPSQCGRIAPRLPSRFRYKDPFALYDLTGCLSTTGYQTPLVETSGSRHFSDLETEVPVSYGILHHDGAVDSDGILMKKYICVSRGTVEDELDSELESLYDSPTRSLGNKEARHGKEWAQLEIRCG